MTASWQSWLHQPTRPRAGKSPLRAELFSVEQLARHARTLAQRHTELARQSSTRLLAQLDANEQCLKAFNHGTSAANPSQRLTPAAEWLL
ncbi:MAG: hypothetical protein ACAI44_13960, partial [Candidatus Sericytochromatia bacterium]